MDLDGILTHGLLQFPIKQDDRTYFPSFVSTLLRDYSEVLRDKGAPGDIIDHVQHFRDHIFLALEHSYAGDTFNAYSSFKDAMNQLTSDLQKLIVHVSDVRFYRARVSERSQYDYTVDEMFHIPFQMRTKVSTQRFSIPGLPCLYLGASPYVCWLELSRPSLDMFNVALISANDSHAIRVLDISRTPSMVQEDYRVTGELEAICDYLRVWPLIALCSVCVWAEEDPFKPEYIIPQMLLQWVLIEKDLQRDCILVDGIRYFTMKANSISALGHQLRLPYPRLYWNYAFPVRTNGVKGWCPELAKAFSVSSTISGRTTQLSLPQRNPGVFFSETAPTEVDKEQIVLPDGRVTLYSQSAFMWFEKVLKAPSRIDSFDGDIWMQYKA